MNTPEQTTTPATEPKRKRKMPSLEYIMQCAERGDGTGFCKACGAENSGVEPDARNYPCDACGEERVFGAEEFLI